MSSRIASTIILLMVFGSPGRAGGHDSATEKFKSYADKLRLIQKAVAPWNSVNSWLIEYEATPSAATPDSNPVHKIMAVSAPGDFYHLSAHFPSYPWQVDPFCQEVFIHQGRMSHRWRFNRAYSEKTINTGDYLPGTTWMDVLLGIIPSWPLSEYKMPADPGSGMAVILVEALRSADFRLLANSEFISGEDCAVLDYKGIERIWIGTSKGLCVVRRDTRHPRTRRLLARLLTDKVDQIAEGLWLPTEYRIQFFRAAQSTSEDKVERENKICILRCLLNDDVPASTFIPVNRPGSIKYDEEYEFTQVFPGGEDLLEDLVGFMVKYAGLPTKPIPHDPPYLWLVVGLTSGLCAGLFLLRKRKRGFNSRGVPDTPAGLSGPNFW